MVGYKSLQRSLTAACLVTLTLILAGCAKPPKPSASWETAVQGLYTASLSKNGVYGLIGSINHGGSLWEMSGKKRLFSWNHTQGEYTSLVASAISPEGSYAATASERSIVLWNTSNGEAFWFWSTPGDVLSIALTPNGDYALLGLDNHTAVLFDIKNGGIKRTFNHGDKVRSVALSDDAKLALTGSDDRTVKLWDLESSELLHTWEHENQVLKVALSGDGRYAFSAAQANRAVVWDSRSGAEVQVMPISDNPYIAAASYTAAAFSADGSQLLTGTNSQLVQLWNLNNGTEAKRWEVPKRSNWKPTAATVLAVSFSERSGIYYAIASNGLSHELK